MVNDAMETAFEMAQTSLTALENEMSDQYVSDVFKWLFFRDNETPDINSMTSVRCERSSSWQRTTMLMVTVTLNGIINMRTKVDKAKFGDVVSKCRTMYKFRILTCRVESLL